MSHWFDERSIWRKKAATLRNQVSITKYSYVFGFYCNFFSLISYKKETQIEQLHLQNKKIKKGEKRNDIQV